MSYQVLARKYRPQRFDDVVGQEVVTRTLRNAIASKRIAHAFVFAGSRGCGKTTTARILARALNCEKGPTPDPCGVCDACVEIAQGRDLDVLEIDAASHTGVDNIREVVIAGLAFPPARDRYKVFIIDEVHQLSSASFNALLKSIEEPPPHAVFMMATTELHKIPDTILSRSQVFEFRTISPKDITNQLKRIAEIEQIEASDTAFALIARAAEGSMRDAQSALDQVIAFAGKTVGVDDVSTVLGLVGRDLLMDVIDAVVAEDGPRAFALTERAVESGTDLRLVCRELSQVVRDMMVMTVDPSRVGDAELAPEERERLAVLTREFSKEDLMRAFDLLSTAEQEIRNVSHPRYYFEMILLRWMHLRKLVPLSELLEQMGGAGIKSVPRTISAPTSAKVAPTSAKVAPASSKVAPTSSTVAPTSKKIAPTGSATAPISDKVAPTSSLKDALLAEIRSGKGFFYNTVVAQAQKIDVADDRVTFTFLPAHKALREQFDQSRAWLEAAAERLSGRKIVVSAVQAAADNLEPVSPEPKAAAPAGPPKRDLKAEALESTGVQALLDVFPAEIRDVEEM
ncbi:MAG TPA: DNA polymerase III subunit gamma/tau [Vicinamibacterales bacterium]|nr:DNA polymerase III subunit gamma/tau [Vicinamibacterales bacterium]